MLWARWLLLKLLDCDKDTPEKWIDRRRPRTLEEDRQ